MVDDFIFLTNSNSKVDTDNSISDLRGGMGSCRHMAVGRCGSNRSISNNSRCGSSRSTSSRQDSNRISSCYYSLTIPFIMHRPNGGSGGPFDCGSNATRWYQEESPPPPNSPMGSVYQCKRCGGLGYIAQICTTPQRFDGTCNRCGQYGYRHHNCITNKYPTHAHANVIRYQSGFN